MNVAPNVDAVARAQAVPTKAQNLDASSQPVSTHDGQAPGETDFANYFCTYGYVFHQVRLRLSLMKSLHACAVTSKLTAQQARLPAPVHLKVCRAVGPSPSHHA